MSEGKINVQAVITDIVPIDQAAEACEKLIQTPNEALGVVSSQCSKLTVRTHEWKLEQRENQN